MSLNNKFEFQEKIELIKKELDDLRSNIDVLNNCLEINSNVVESKSVNDVNDKTVALIETIKRLKKENECIKINTESKIKNQLRYRLGDAIIKISNPYYKLIFLPYVLYQEYLNYKKEKKISLNNPIISIIIPAYNAEKYIDKCINSILNQTFKNFEIIVVDDGSTDSTRAIIESLMKENSKIKLIKQKNLHAGVARNSGLNIAKGKYVLFLDADDFFEKTMLEDCYVAAIEHKADLVIFKGREYNDQTKQFLDCKFPISTNLLPRSKVFSYKDLKDKIFQLTGCIAWNKLISMQLIKEYNFKFSNLKSSNDTLFIYSVLVKAKRICFLNKVLANYRVGNPSSLQRSKKSSWECICLAFFQLKKQLINLNVYDEVKRSYINKALQACLYYMNSLDFETKSIMELSLVDKYFKLLDIYGNADKKGYIYNKNFYQNYKILKSKKYIPIVYATDSNYFKYMVVSMKSVLEHCNQARVIFFVLCDSSISDYDKLQLKNELIKYDSVVEFINMDSYFNDVSINIEHTTYHTYYRLMIPSILHFINKLVYLDCDVILNDDISLLFDYKLDNNYLAGVLAPAFVNKKHSNRLSVDTSNYINAGVLLVNNRLLIKDKIQQKFLEAVKNNYSCQDQDVLNVVCLNRIMLLPAKFNFMTKYLSYYDKYVSEGLITKSDYEEAKSSPIIIHFADKVKPWDDPSISYADYYWRYAKD